MKEQQLKEKKEEEYWEEVIRIDTEKYNNEEIMNANMFYEKHGRLLNKSEYNEEKEYWDEMTYDDTDYEDGLEGMDI